MTFVILLAAMAFVFFFVVLSGVKIIRPFERGLVERLGKYHATTEPGLRLILPFIDRMVRVEIQRIDPPADVMHAMHEQMKAERTRRASVTTAQGDREAAIARAEGAKQSKILEAEGHREAQILDAQGRAEATKAEAEAEQFRQQAVATGQADAIRSVYQAIHEGNPTADVLAVKYLETLVAVANGQATKIFLPLEASAVLGALGPMRDLFGGVEVAAAPTSNGVAAP